MSSNLMRHFFWHFGKNLLSDNNACMLLNHELRKVTYHNALTGVMAYHFTFVTNSVYILYSLG